MNEWLHSGLLLITGFLVGVINTLGGGGSSLLYPLLIFMGFSPHQAVGTSRLAFLTQGIVGILGFKSKGFYEYPLNIRLGLIAAAGAFIGAAAGLSVNPGTYKKIIALVIALVTIAGFFHTRRPEKTTKTDPRRILTYILFFFLGIYSGFIQTGLGFLILTTLLWTEHMNITRANSIKAMVVFLSGIPSLLMFSTYGQVRWHEAVLLALGTAAGSWWSSRWSTSVNEKKLKYLIALLVLFLAAKLWFY